MVSSKIYYLKEDNFSFSMCVSVQLIQKVEKIPHTNFSCAVKKKSYLFTLEEEDNDILFRVFVCIANEIRCGHTCMYRLIEAVYCSW